MPFQARRELALSLTALLLLALHARPAAAGRDRWTPLGPEGGLITALAADPGSPGTLYASAEGGLWKSTDGGGRWSLASRDLGLGDGSLLTFRSLVVDPGTPGRVFALTDNGTFRSPDGGATWRRILSNAFDGAVDLAVSPADPAIVMTIVGQHVLRSDDGGDHWVLVMEPTFLTETTAKSASTARSLVFDPADPSLVYAMAFHQVFFSTNAGLTWRARENWPGGDRLLFDPTDPRTLYMQGGGTFWKSTDAGATWRQLHGLEEFLVEAVAIDPADPSVLYAGTTSGLVRSEDGGETWEVVPATPPVLSLEVDPAHSGRVWLGSGGQGVFRSLDSGRTWLASRQGLNAATFSTAAFDPFRPEILYAVGNTGALRSTDRGATWSQITPRSSYGLSLLVPHPLREGVLFASGGEGLFRSASRGTRWEPVLPGEDFGAFAFHPRRPGILFRSGFYGVYRSNDGGRTWDRIDSIPNPNYPGRPDEIRQLLLSPRRPATVFALTVYGGLLRSPDLGRRWQNVDTPKAAVLASDPATAGLHYLATEEGGEIWRSLDDGVSWQRIARGGAGGAFPTALRVDPRAPSNLYLGTFGTGVWRSADRGVTWKPLNTGITAPWITCLDTDPRSPHHLLACTLGGGLLEIRLSL